MSNVKKEKRILGVQKLRGLAAITVVLFHGIVRYRALVTVVAGIEPQAFKNLMLDCTHNA